LKNNPLSPKQVACWGGDKYTHDVQCVNYDGPDSSYQGKEICFCFNEDTVTIVDVTQKGNIKQLSKVTYPGADYVHQGWLTEDKKYLLVDDEGDEGGGKKTRTMVFRVTDLKKPAYMYTSNSPLVAIDHNLYIKGNRAYMSNYAAGLRIHGLGNIESKKDLAEIAYFDVWPKSNKATFEGVWSSYIYFPSGNILISGTEYGVFVVKEKDAGPTASPTTSSPTPPTLAPTPKPTSPGPVKCRTVLDEASCLSHSKTSFCRWGIKGGEQVPRCYAPCASKPLKRRKNCIKAPSCVFRKAKGTKKRKCYERAK
jgi:hypothetical protein